MKLVLAKIKHGFDKNMPVVQDDVSQIYFQYLKLICNLHQQITNNIGAREWKQKAPDTQNSRGSAKWRTGSDHPWRLYYWN